MPGRDGGHGNDSALVIEPTPLTETAGADRGRDHGDAKLRCPDQVRHQALGESYESWSSVSPNLLGAPKTESSVCRKPTWD
jgi:hypothetical protein